MLEVNTFRFCLVTTDFFRRIRRNSGTFFSQLKVCSEDDHEYINIPTQCVALPIQSISDCDFRICFNYLCCQVATVSYDPSGSWPCITVKARNQETGFKVQEAENLKQSAI